jgi:hypothetical protein
MERLKPDLTLDELEVIAISNILSIEPKECGGKREDKIKTLSKQPIENTELLRTREIYCFYEINQKSKKIKIKKSIDSTLLQKV